MSEIRFQNGKFIFPLAEPDDAGQISPMKPAEFNPCTTTRLS
jgi:hypothetical protein